MSLSAIVNGTSYSLDNMTYCRWMSHDGFGMSPMHRLSERGPLQHGETDRGYRLDPRMINLVFAIIKSSEFDVEQARLDLLSIFKPSVNPIILEYISNTGTYRIDCHYIGGMPMPSSDKHGLGQLVTVQLKADDPTWYNPVADNYVFGLGGGADTMEVPTVIPMTIGASTIDVSTVVTNEGTVSAYPTIRITGPIHDCVITNNSTGEKLDFTGDTIAASHYYDIDLRYGYKTITDNHGVNQIAALTSDSDLVSFHLGCAPDVVNGQNSITVTGSTATLETSISMVWIERYIGI